MPDALSSRLLPQRELSQELRAAIARLKMSFWKYDFEAQIRWLENETEPDDQHLMLLQDGVLVGYLRLTRRFIVGAGEQPALLGVGTVAIAPALQGQGLGFQLMFLANAVICSEPRTFGALCCAADKVKFYQKCGWTVSERSFVRADEPHRPFFYDENVLTLGLRLPLPAIVHVTGKPF